MLYSLINFLIELLISIQERLVARRLQNALTSIGYDLSDLSATEFRESLKTIRNLKSLSDAEVYDRIRQHQNASEEWSRYEM